MKIENNPAKYILWSFSSLFILLCIGGIIQLYLHPALQIDKFFSVTSVYGIAFFVSSTQLKRGLNCFHRTGVLSFVPQIYFKLAFFILRFLAYISSLLFIFNLIAFLTE